MIMNIRCKFIVAENSEVHLVTSVLCVLVLNKYVYFVSHGLYRLCRLYYSSYFCRQVSQLLVRKFRYCKVLN